MELKVREITKNDFEPLISYWMDADDDFLIQMGVDLNKMPTKKEFEELLNKQLNADYPEKETYALIWEADGKPVGHSNINKINYGEEATMHLHLWQNSNRKKGIGSILVKKSLPFYFKNFNLKTLWCEPYAENPSPSRTLEKIGFEFVKKYRTIPGMLNFEQDVNQWRLTKKIFDTFE